MIEPESTVKPPLKVLVVEDNLPDVLLIEETARELGYQLHLTHYLDGEEAVSKLTSGDAAQLQYDLIILDINMPRISGLEVLASLRGSSHLATIPVLVLTSSLSPTEQREALRLGASGFVKKPSDLYEFLSQVGGKMKELVDGAGKKRQ